MAVRGLDDLTSHRKRAPAEFWGVALWGVACTVVHFSSMEFLLYSKIWWWDLFVHAASGFGVAGIGYVLFPAWARHPLGRWLVLPLAVLAIGTWFEVYERLFTDFWIHWSPEFYWTDTLEDLVADTAGGVVFGLLLWVRLRLDRLRADRSRSGSQASR